jgi:hypothetical protein
MDIFETNHVGDLLRRVTALEAEVRQRFSGTQDETDIRANEREKIARLLEGRINDPQQGSVRERQACATVLRDLARALREQGKPQTGERRLIKALREIDDLWCSYDQPEGCCPRCIAREALNLERDHH